MSHRKAAHTNFPGSILVGVDEKGLADHAVGMALELGRRLDAGVEFVQAVPVPPNLWIGTDPVRSAALSSEVLAETAASVNRRVRQLVQGSRHPIAESGERAEVAVLPTLGEDLVRVVPGHPAQVLVEEARRCRAGLLMIGSHGRREALDFGNTMRAIFAKATIPVWVQSQPVTPIRRILVAVDLSKESLTGLAIARSLAQRLGAELRVLRCFHFELSGLAEELGYTISAPAYPVDEISAAEFRRFEEAMAEFDWQDVPHRTEFVDGEPVRKILEAAPSSDLVVLGAQGRTGLASVLLGGVAYAVLKRSPRPALVVRASSRSFLI